MVRKIQPAPWVGPITGGVTARPLSSRRFILQTGSSYLKNMAALWAVQPKLAAEIEALDGLGEGLAIEPAKSGAPTLVARTTDGKAIALHSRYDPAGEGR